MRPARTARVPASGLIARCRRVVAPGRGLCSGIWSGPSRWVEKRPVPLPKDVIAGHGPVTWRPHRCEHVVSRAASETLPGRARHLEGVGTQVTSPFVAKGSGQRHRSGSQTKVKPAPAQSGAGPAGPSPRATARREARRATVGGARVPSGCCRWWPSRPSSASPGGRCCWAYPAWLVALLLLATGAVKWSFALFLGVVFTAAIATSWAAVEVAKGKDGLRAARAAVIIVLAAAVPGRLRPSQRGRLQPPQVHP